MLSLLAFLSLFLRPGFIVKRISDQVFLELHLLVEFLEVLMFMHSLIFGPGGLELGKLPNVLVHLLCLLTKQSFLCLPLLLLLLEQFLSVLLEHSYLPPTPFPLLL